MTPAQQRLYFYDSLEIIMPRLLPVQREHASGALAETLGALQRKLGKVPNFLATLGHAPAALHGYLGLAETLSGGRLTPLQREVIALAVGQANACRYCVAAHSQIGKSIGLSDAAIAEARGARSEDPQTAEIARLAVLILRRRGALSESDLAGLHDAGIDDALVVEIIAHVALNTLSNYVNRFVGTHVDFPEIAWDGAE